QAPRRSSAHQETQHG
ncbi:TetW-regulatory peptide, partial [Dysosmobacter welbionis]